MAGWPPRANRSPDACIRVPARERCGPFREPANGRLDTARPRRRSSPASRCPGTCQVYNNLLWSNDGAGLWLNTPDGFLSHNDFGNRGGDTPLGGIGSTHLNPHLFNPLAGNYRLAGDSPVLAISPLVLDATDLFDRPHPASGVRDVGAYAETIFTDGSELVH